MSGSERAGDTGRVNGSRRVPVLARGVRLRTLDNGNQVLLKPEGIVKLNGTAAAALRLVDGARTIASISATLQRQFDAPARSIDADVVELFCRLHERGWIFFSLAGTRL